MWACFKRFGPELYDRTTAPLSLKVRMLKAEVIETLLYGCVTRIGAPSPASHWLPTPTAYRAHHPFDAKALKKARCESIETTIRKRRLFFAGAVVRQNEGRLPGRVMLGKMTGGEGRRPGEQSES